MYVLAYAMFCIATHNNQRLQQIKEEDDRSSHNKVLSKIVILMAYSMFLDYNLWGHNKVDTDVSVLRFMCNDPMDQQILLDVAVLLLMI